MIVDNMAMQLVSRPQQFDVMVMVRQGCLGMMFVLTKGDIS